MTAPRVFRGAKGIAEVERVRGAQRKDEELLRELRLAELKREDADFLKSLSLRHRLFFRLFRGPILKFANTVLEAATRQEVIRPDQFQELAKSARRRLRPTEKEQDK